MTRHDAPHDVDSVALQVQRVGCRARVLRPHSSSTNGVGSLDREGTETSPKRATETNRETNQPSRDGFSSFAPTGDAFGVTAAELIVIVRRMVRRASGGVTHDLEDAVQETLCRLLTADVHRVDPTRNVAGFVALRARWTLADGRRREARQGRADARFVGGLDAVARSPEDEAIAAENGREQARKATVATAALASLDAEARALVVAHDIDGVSLRTLATAAGVNVSTLSRRRVVALHAVRIRLSSRLTCFQVPAQRPAAGCPH